jgi:hypothetical protein
VTVLALWTLLAAALPAGEPPADSFVLALGSNASVDTALAPLRYADDDAIRYVELFRALGARSFLVTRPDENTSRVYPALAAEARPPLQAALDRTIDEIAVAVVDARRLGHRTRLYFTFAGHGNLRDGRAYLTIEDARLDGDWLRKLIDRVGADESHLIVDACHATLLAYGRGPGGTHRAVHGFVVAAALAQDPNVGLLLSSSASGEAHEWEGFQAGVFSHEVRSGLYGAADVDGDGRVSYAEIAAFVGRANDPIANERYRPDVFARPAQARSTLVDLRPAQAHAIQLDGAEASAHYLLEDGRGVRVADFHSAPGQALSLVRPSAAPQLYLRRLDDQQEFVLPAAGDPVVVSGVLPAVRRSSARGAAHEAFSLIFTLAFDRAVVARYEAAAVARPVIADAPGRASWRSPVAVGLGALAAAGGAFAIQQGLHARSLGDHVPAAESQVDASARNDRIHASQRNAILLGAGGLALALAAAGILLWTPHHADLELAAADDFTGVALRW